MKRLIGRVALLALGGFALIHMPVHALSPAAPIPSLTAQAASSQVPHFPHFPCEDFSHGSPPKCTPTQQQVLIDRNCAQSRAHGDDCGIAVAPDGTWYAYNIQTPEHAAASKATAQDQMRKFCDRAAQNGWQCNVIDSDP